MAGKYYVLDCAKGTVVKEIPCGEPILGAPVVVGERVYFATFGSKVYSLKADGTIAWTWDFVEEVLKFPGNRWSGEEWLKHKQGRVTWRDQFLCTQDLAAQGDLIVLPVSGSALVLRDLGTRAEVQVQPIPSLNGLSTPRFSERVWPKMERSFSNGTGGTMPGGWRSSSCKARKPRPTPCRTPRQRSSFRAC
jgi:hypothetical protein